MQDHSRYLIFPTFILFNIILGPLNVNLSVSKHERLCQNKPPIILACGVICGLLGCPALCLNIEPRTQSSYQGTEHSLIINNSCSRGGGEKYLQLQTVVNLNSF